MERGHNYWIFFLWRYSPNLGLGLPTWNSPFHFGLLDLGHPVEFFGRAISSSQGLYLYTNRKRHTHKHIHALSGIRSHDPGFRASENSACLRPLGYRDRHQYWIMNWKGYERKRSCPNLRYYPGSQEDLFPVRGTGEAATVAHGERLDRISHHTTDCLCWLKFTVSVVLWVHSGRASGLAWR
jgi:hypothetical protein